MEATTMKIVAIFLSFIPFFLARWYAKGDARRSTIFAFSALAVSYVLYEIIARLPQGLTDSLKSILSTITTFVGSILPSAPLIGTSVLYGIVAGLVALLTGWLLGLWFSEHKIPAGQWLKLFGATVLLRAMALFLLAQFLVGSFTLTGVQSLLSPGATDMQSNPTASPALANALNEELGSPIFGIDSTHSCCVIYCSNGPLANQNQCVKDCDAGSLIGSGCGTH